ncbi:hypothetical protein LPC10_01930 [Methylorubrum sp. B1-46]|uniref:hypothetical protein n=1 Tax=Methylorubrum sp. B1-46 TaxID=2897334 RepID=UPI001E347B8D|nr:hypothetical protein [Methylorubrum sp. B1-46]UGB26400.1 hypothetical protein LPC10_01930 [Methylorubrum sp. B1-46]
MVEHREHARELIRHSLKVGAPGLAEPAREAIVRSIMLKLEGKVLAPLLAALQQVTAERDEYALVLSDCAAALAQVPLGQLPGCVDMMVVSALDAPLPNGERSEIIAAAERIKARVTAERDEARAELARLRAEGEAKDRALKAKAEEQVAYWRKRQQAEKCLEDGASEDGLTYTPIGDVAAWQGGYCNDRMSEADWWLKTILHWPNEAARAATAREG